MTELWSIKLVATAIETPPELNFGQGVFHCIPKPLCYNLDYMNKLTPNIQEVIAFLNWLSVKQKFAETAKSGMCCIAIFGPLEQILS